MRRIIAISSLALIPLAAAAQVLGDPDVIEALMADQGMPVARDIDDYGDPRITSEVEGVQFAIYFYDCAPVCRSLQFVAAFDRDRNTSLATANEWNRDYRFAKVYVDDEGDPFIEMDVNLAGDGVGRRNFNDLLDGWRRTLADFRDYINW